MNTPSVVEFRKVTLKFGKSITSVGCSPQPEAKASIPSDSTKRERLVMALTPSIRFRVGLKSFTHRSAKCSEKGRSPVPRPDPDRPAHVKHPSAPTPRFGD